MNVQTLLVVDDEPNIAFSIRQSLRSEQLVVATAASAREGLEFIRRTKPDAVLLDVRLPDMSGLDVYDLIREIDQRLPVVIMTAYSRTETAIEAMRRGAFDYLVKPVDLTRLREVVQKAMDVSRLRRVPAVILDEFDADESNADVIVGHSAAMQEVYKLIGRVAGQDATVLILGESGTGKELVARAIYHYSQRKQNPFLAINCAALPEALLESELFGHERGAFTGADQRRIGKFEQLNGGTILLDEIGDMSPATQAKALRLLQQQQFERLGGNVTIQADVRVIAATNRDIATMVENGLFRRDLYYRLNVFTIVLPPLRQRTEDIPQLAWHFIRRLAAEAGHRVQSITPDALELLMQHSWPGNVREFASAMRFAVTHATSDVITVDCLPPACRTRSSTSAGFVEPGLDEVETPVPSSTAGPAAALEVSALVRQLLECQSTGIYRKICGEVDRVVLDLVLRHVQGNQVQAAELLGISRQTLRSKLKATQSNDDEGKSDEASDFDGLPEA